jgi:hypothetical protein
MASVDSPRAPAAPMPASPQSNPPGAETRTICTAGCGDGVLLAAGGLRSNRAEAAAGAMAPSASASASVVLIGPWFGRIVRTFRVADHPM